MNDKHITGFSDGMNQDISKTQMSPNTYYNAENFRVTTDKGLSNFSLENIRGNINLAGLEFPNLNNVIKISIDNTIPGAITLEIVAGFIVNSSAVPFNVTATTTPKDLYNHITTDPGFVTGDLNIKYKVSYNDTHLLLHTIGYHAFFQAGEVYSPGTLIIDNAFIPTNTGFIQPIGSTYINDDIYILTTTNTTINPGGHTEGVAPDASSTGQIWKLVLDKTTDPFTATLELVYYNYVDFTTYYPIAPSAIEGRYEIPQIQRIYWTDNYNKLRSLNVADPQAFATDLSILDIIPSVDFDIPILVDIHNGSSAVGIKIGMYQLAYRLSNVGGAVTAFSNLSNMVYVVPSDENISKDNVGIYTAGSFKDYVGAAAGNTVKKDITWLIENIDTSFQRIELAIYFKETLDDAGTFNIFASEDLSTDSFSFTFNGDLTKLPLTINEFLLTAGAFTHGKTLATKNNRLIVGNVRNEKGDISFTEFDARAYRYTAGGGTLILKENGLDVDYTGNLSGIVEESDAINPDQDVYKYNNLTGVLGGSGLNISYEFYTTDIQAEWGDVPGATQFSVALNAASPWRFTTMRYFGSPNENLGVLSPTNTLNVSALQEYPLAVPLLRDGFKYPHITGLHRGYQRGEIYRFGIQFYDKSKNPMFVKWIGDIKMPDLFDNNTNAFYEDGSSAQYVDGIVGGFDDFRTSYTTNQGGQMYAYVRSLGIKFTVDNLETIEDQISGYSIVRLKREASDKTIVAQGYITRVQNEGGEYFMPQIETSATSNTAGNLIYGTNNYQQRCFFVSPENIHVTVPITTGMTFKIKSMLTESNPDTTSSRGGPADWNLFKLYYQGLPPVFTQLIDEVGELSYGQSNVIIGTDTVNNYPPPFPFGMAATGATSVGNQAYYMILDADIPWGVIGGATSSNKFLVNIERTLTNQYGGNTFTNRADNEYISCSNFKPIRADYTNNETNNTFVVFGGDTYVNTYDSHRWAKNDGAVVPPNSGGIPRQCSSMFFAVESVINTDLRHGTYLNKILGAGPGDTTIVETYDYNPIYSCENEVVKYFPKPDPFIQNDVWVNRFYASEIKTNGELSDSWAMFNEYWDVDGSNGPITACGSLGDEIYFVQHSALGKLLVSPKASTSTSIDQELRIGTGEVLDSHQYYSVETGCKHQFSFLKTPSAIMFFDIRTKKMINFAPGRAIEPLSDTKGMSAFFRAFVKGELEVSDKPTYRDTIKGINAIHGVYDYTHNEMIYTIHRADATEVSNIITLVYNEKISKFTAFYGHHPRLYITNNQDFFSVDTHFGGMKLWLHNYGEYVNFYGSTGNSIITFFANKYPSITKSFTNFEFQTEMQDGNTLIDIASGGTPIQDSFDIVTASTDYQTGQIVFNPGVNMKRRLRTWRSEVPKSNAAAAYVSAGILAKLRDKYLKATFSFINNNNRRLIVHDIITYFNLTK